MTQTINLGTFCHLYAEELTRARAERPADYIWPENELPAVLERMCLAFKRGTYSKDSLAIRRVCKRLHIKHTYQAINAYLKGEPA